MDLYKAIQDLYAEKEKLERVIASLEELTANGRPTPGCQEPKTPGTKIDGFRGASGSFGADEEVLGRQPQVEPAQKGHPQSDG